MVLTPGSRSFDSRSSASTVPLTDPLSLSAHRIAEDAADLALNGEEMDDAHSDMLSAIHSSVGPIEDEESLRSAVTEALSQIQQGTAPAIIYEVAQSHSGSRASTQSGVAGTLHSAHAELINPGFSVPSAYTVPTGYTNIYDQGNSGNSSISSRPSGSRRTGTSSRSSSSRSSGSSQFRFPREVRTPTLSEAPSDSGSERSRNTANWFSPLSGMLSRGPQFGRGVKGKRKSTASKRMYLAGAGVASAGPKAADHGWQKFGKYILARNDLENGDRVHIRYCNGQPIRRIPVKIAGSGVKAVLSSIADKKRPAASDMDKLTDEERKYVQSLIKTASIAPTEITSTKSDKEQMKHEFEKMKGQIVAGNDSPELIKKFKQTIKAMQQSKLLPAASVSEILHELSTLGH